jgi:hypothetical protein
MIRELTTLLLMYIAGGITMYYLIAFLMKHPRRHKKFNLKGGDFMYIVKDSQVDVPFQIGFTVTDAKGDPVPTTAVVVAVVSDNPSAVKVIPGADQLSGTVSFGVPNADGTPALANITVTVSLPDGTVVGSFGAQFTVTAGDPAAIAGGNIVFTGLVEAVAKNK